VPTYQYTCTACGEPLEAVQSFSDHALTECPACGGSLRKVFSAVGVVFKGSGFYRNDSRDGARAKERAGKDKVDAASVAGKNGSDGSGAASGSKEGSASSAGSKESGSSSSGSSSSGSSGSSSTPAAAAP